jgi:hypothetical protein
MTLSHEQRLNMRGGSEPAGLSKPFEYGAAPIVDGGWARLRAAGERLQQIGQLGVAVPFHKARHTIDPATAARLADDRIDSGGSRCQAAKAAALPLARRYPA